MTELFVFLIILIYLFYMTAYKLPQAGKQNTERIEELEEQVKILISRLNLLTELRKKL